MSARSVAAYSFNVWQVPIKTLELPAWHFGEIIATITVTIAASNCTWPSQWIFNPITRQHDTPTCPAFVLLSIVILALLDFTTVDWKSSLRSIKFHDSKHRKPPTYRKSKRLSASYFSFDFIRKKSRGMLRESRFTTLQLAPCDKSDSTMTS